MSIMFPNYVHQYKPKLKNRDLFSNNSNAKDFQLPYLSWSQLSTCSNNNYYRRSSLCSTTSTTSYETSQHPPFWSKASKIPVGWAYLKNGVGHSHDSLILSSSPLATDHSPAIPSSYKHSIVPSPTDIFSSESYPYTWNDTSTSTIPRTTSTLHKRSYSNVHHQPLLMSPSSTSGLSTSTTNTPAAVVLPPDSPYRYNKPDMKDVDYLTDKLQQEQEKLIAYNEYVVNTLLTETDDEHMVLPTQLPLTAMPSTSGLLLHHQQQHKSSSSKYSRRKKNLRDDYEETENYNDESSSSGSNKSSAGSSSATRDSGVGSLRNNGATPTPAQSEDRERVLSPLSLSASSRPQQKSPTKNHLEVPGTPSKNYSNDTSTSTQIQMRQWKSSPNVIDEPEEEQITAKKVPTPILVSKKRTENTGAGAGLEEGRSRQRSQSIDALNNSPPPSSSDSSVIRKPVLARATPKTKHRRRSLTREKDETSNNASLNGESALPMHDANVEALYNGVSGDSMINGKVLTETNNVYLRSDEYDAQEFDTSGDAGAEREVKSYGDFRNPRKIVPKKVYKGSYHECLQKRSQSQDKSVFPLDMKPIDSPKAGLNQALTKLSTTEWETNVEGFRLLVRLLRYNPDAIRPDLHIIILTGLKHLTNLRSQVSRAACLFFKEMFENVGKWVEQHLQDVDRIAEKLLDKSADTNKFIREDASSALEALVHNIPPVKALNALESYGARHRNALVRCTTARMTSIIVTKIGAERSFTELGERLLPMLVRFLQEGSLETRNYAKVSFCVLASNRNFESQLRRHVTPEALRHVTKAIVAIKNEVHGRRV